METITVDITHRSGLQFRVNLSRDEFQKVDSDEDYANQLAEKYFNLHKNGLVSAINAPTPGPGSSQIESQIESQMQSQMIDEEQLISLVSDRRPLFDFRIPLKERSRDITRSLWEEIIAEMNVDVTVEWISKKWKYIRDSYIRVRGNIKRKIASGSSAEEKLSAEKLMRNHRHYELLLFLDDTLTTRKTTSNFTNELTTDEDSFGSSIQETDSETPKIRRSEKQGQVQMTVQDEAFIDVIKSLSQPVPQPAQRENTSSTENFCRRLCDGLERLPPRVRNQLQVEFLSRLTDMENKYLYPE